MANEDNPYAQFTPIKPTTAPVESDNPYAQFTPIKPAEPAKLPNPIQPISQEMKSPVTHYMEGLATNAGKEISEIPGGVGAIGAYLNQQRVDTSIPAMVREPQLLSDMIKKPSVESAWKALSPVNFEGAHLAKSGENTLKIGQGIIDSYRKNYVEPIQAGIEKHDPMVALQGIHDNFYQQPISMGSDLLAGAGAVGKGLAFAGKAKMFTGIASKLAPLKASAATSIQNWAHVQPFLGPRLLRMYETEAYKRVVDDIQRHWVGIVGNNHAMEDAYLQAERDVKAAGLDPDKIIEAGEMREPGRGRQYRQIPSVAHYFDMVNAEKDVIGQQLVNHGAFSQADFYRAKYGPYAVAQYGDASPASINAAYRDLQAANINPTMFNIKGRAEVRQLLGLKKHVLGAPQIGRNLRGQNPILEGFTQARTANSGAGNRMIKGIATHAHDVHSAGMLEAQLYLNLQDVLGRLLNHPNLPRGTFPVDIPQAITNFGMQSGIDNAAIQRLIAKAGITTVHLPKRAAKLLNKSLGLESGGKTFWDKVTDAYKSNALGLNPNWMVGQTEMNVLMLPFILFNSPHPREAARSIMAIAMGFDSRVRRMIELHQPDVVGEVPRLESLRHLIDDHAQTLEALINAEDPHHKIPFKLTTATAVANVFGALDWYKQRIFAGAQLGDNYTRIVTFMHKVASEADKYLHSRLPLQNAFEYQAMHLQVEQALTQDAALGVQPGAKELFGKIAADDVFRWYGKYDALTSAEWAVMRKLVPYWLWWMHAFSIATALPLKAPMRTALLQKLVKYTPIALQPPDLAERYKRGGNISTYNRAGTPLYLDGIRQLDTPGSLGLPIMQPVEWITQASLLTQGGNEGGMPLLNSGLNAVFTLAGQDMSKLDHFRNPQYISTRGRLYNQNKEEQKITPIPLSNYMGRLLYPSIDKNIHDQMTFPYRSSDQTTLIDNQLQQNMNPQQHDGQFVRQVHADLPPWIDRLPMMAQQFFKAATMAEVTTQSKESIMNARNKADATKSVARHPIDFAKHKLGEKY